MAIEIKFGDFDTVCYSSQHNIIELINNAVGISIEINLTQSQVSSLADQLQTVADQAQEGHDAKLLAENLNTRVSSNTYWIEQMRDDGPAFQTTTLGGVIDDLFRQVGDLNTRVTNLGG